MDDSKHLRPYKTCVICHHHVYDMVDLVFAVLSELGHYYGYTLPFVVPERGHSFHESTIYTKSKVYSCRICQAPRCKICSTSPEAFLCHLDCFELVSTQIYCYDKKTAWKFLPPIICQRAKFFNAWPQAREDYSLSLIPKRLLRLPQPEPKRLFNTLGLPFGKEHMTLKVLEAIGFPVFLTKMFHLPLELLQIVEAFSANCILWRLFAALGWSITGEEMETETRMLRELVLWRRGSLLGEMSAANLILLGVDDLGIKEVQPFDKPPSDLYMTSIWYTLLDTASLDSIRVEIRNGHLHLCSRPENLILWDAPNIPDPSFSHIAGTIPSSCRLRTIVLKYTLIGLTFFVYGGRIYAIHAHYHDQVSSSPLETYLKIPLKRRQFMVWIFVPLKSLPHERKIDALWLRCIRDVPDLFACPSLVIRTGRGRVHTIGLHCHTREAIDYHSFEDLGGGSISHLIYNDSDLGQEITKFGACASRRLRLRPPRQMPKFPNINKREEKVYYSHASLANVSSVDVFCERESNFCRGILLHYLDGDEQVLGQKRDDLIQSKYISPLYFSYKHIGNYVHVQFHSTWNEDKDIHETDYHMFRMEGNLVWWFYLDYDFVEIWESTSLCRHSRSITRKEKQSFN